MKLLSFIVIGLSILTFNSQSQALEVGEDAPCVVLDHYMAGVESSHCIRDPFVEGQPVIIEFFSITCSACLVNIPKIQALAKSLEGKATVRLVSIDRNEELVRDFIAKNNIELEVAFDVDRYARRAYDIIYTPTMFLLNQGNVVEIKHIGVLNEKSLDELIKKVEELN